jgi:TetR/AcrR family transcriptional regulator, regulator of cefoperazone and chloramphenicol sensitivity
VPAATPTIPDPSTRARLLEAAGETFARHGFHHTTIREISRRARSNIAAVNYHFGSKAALYRAVFDHAQHAAMQAQPLGSAARSSDPPDTQLRLYIRSFLARILDEGRPAWHGTLMAREMVEPTAALDTIAQAFVRPQFLYLSSLVRILLGPAGDDDALVRRIACSIAGQCLFYKHARPMIDRAMPEVTFDPASRAILAEHIADFSLAAITQLRQAKA